ncbi:S9 family peptidase [uncultured Massilia sp.]|uniref:alpha/beta hydrolase family protein n=1 Tax=uncultured Massilia sp. TaxID=169973 RepID=UPI0026003219|nr:alpha/beta hydrolase [uncultured Massilia sp.]
MKTAWLGAACACMSLLGAALWLAHGHGAARRPQEPSGALPYALREVVFQAPGPSGPRLAGTLALPPGAGPHPAIVLVPGSGEVDRDGTLSGHRVYLVLADALARRGFAVLRSDKRGLGASGGDFATATTYDFAADIRAAVAFLRTRADEFAEIGAIDETMAPAVLELVATWAGAQARD